MKQYNNNGCESAGLWFRSPNLWLHSLPGQDELEAQLRDPDHDYYVDPNTRDLHADYVMANPRVFVSDKALGFELSKADAK